MNADGFGQRDDCYELGDAMDVLQGLHFHMPGRQRQIVWTTRLPRNCVQMLHLHRRHSLVLRLRGLL